MPRETIRLLADTIDDAAEQIIHLLESADNRRDVIYFHGWFGFGASAVLKAVVKQLRSSSGLADTRTATAMGKIIHVDVSQWQSKRALQKVIAEELELPPLVMALFDQHDEEDDFDGVEQSARGVIPDVKVAIMNELMAQRFLVVLHNGSGSYIDLWEAGVPVMGQLSKRVLWTSRGRFWHHAKDGHGENLQLANLELAKWSDTGILVLPSQIIAVDLEVVLSQVIRRALYAEAEEVAKYTGVPEPDMSPKIVIECILYMTLSDNDHNINWKSHASNYWVCDGIIKDGTNVARSAWEIGDALQGNMSCDFCTDCTEIICEVLSSEQKRFINRWVSVTNKKSKAVQLTSQATSFLWTGGGLEASLSEHCNKTGLHVINLSHCAFSFSSPPFLCCSNLRFLLLDHCKDQDAHDHGGEEKEYHHRSNRSRQGNGACFRNLWVLELSYTDWYWLLSKDMLDLMVDLRELNVKGVGNQSMTHLHRCSGAGSNKRRLIKLRVVADGDPNKAAPHNDDDDGGGGDRNQQISPPVVASSMFFPDLSSWDILKTVILDGCGDLEQIDCNTLPLSLESFTLTSSVTATNKIESISFRGCAKLKHLLLRGLFGRLEELDMSGTAIKTLDLSATQAWGLKRLFLLGCEQLCAILWPQQEEDREISLEILRIDTTTTTYVAGDSREEGKSSKQLEPPASDRTIIDSGLYISVRDPKIFRSLMSLRPGKWFHVEISSTGLGHEGTGQGVNLHKPGGSLYADDIIISTYNGSNSQADGDANRDDAFTKASSVTRSKWLWGCPSIPEYSSQAHGYIRMQDETQTKLLLQGGTASSTRQLINRATTLPAFVMTDARSLHLHDSLSITCLPGPALAAEDDWESSKKLDWEVIEWCRLERCPNIEGVVFNAPTVPSHIFRDLETFWASQLPKARYIWDWSPTSLFRPGSSSFEDLVFLHLDHCPRLVHVLPLFTSNFDGCSSLETLEIVCCGDLRVVFPSDSESQQQRGPREFPSLKRIHLYDLPKLQHICGRRMLAPNLETVKVRGCWGLKRLPAVGRRRSTLPVVDCEKDWWDGLEWDGESAGHHPSHYRPTYSSAYYKKQQLRASVLR